MNPFCVCDGPGQCSRHGIYKGDQRFAHCRGTSGSAGCGVAYWNAWEQGKLGATAPADPQLNPPGFCDKSAPLKISSIGTVLSRIIRSETGIEIPCGECKQDIAALDMLTAEEAVAKKAEFVQRIASRSLQNAQGFLQRLAVKIDAAMNLGIVEAQIAGWFDQAVEAGASPESEKLKVQIGKHTVQPVVRRAHERPAVATTTKEQDRLFQLSQVRRKIARPLANDAVVNLVWHFWPRKNAWQWHADNIRDLLNTGRINGKVLIGIATDETTDSAQDVMDRIGTDGVSRWILNKNIPHNGVWTSRHERFGELQTAIPAMEMLADTGDSVTIYGHAKGAQDHTIASEAVRLWSEMMYETVTFNLNECLDLINDGFDAVGSFRTFGLRPLMVRNKWHYSGTFYTFRTQAMMSRGKPRPFQLRYGGTEAWIGDHIPIEKAACVFADNSPFIRQYELPLMVDLCGQQLQWESKRYGDGPPMEQHVREFDWLVKQLEGIKSLLIIGSRYGGMEHHLSHRAPWLRVASCDIDPAQSNPKCMIGDSHDHEFQGIVRNAGQFDAVFIDGDHSEEGTLQDWEFAKTLNPKRVFFHDFIKSSFHAACGCFVDRAWEKVKAEAEEKNWTISSKSVGCGWGGISQVRF